MHSKNKSSKKNSGKKSKQNQARNYKNNSADSKSYSHSNPDLAPEILGFSPEDLDLDRERDQDREHESSGIIFGRHAVLAYLETSFSHSGSDGNLSAQEEQPEHELSKILMATGLALDERLKKIQRLAKELKVLIVESPRAKLDFLCNGQAHQGVLAYLSPVRTLGLEEFLSQLTENEHSAGSPTNNLIVALDGLEDPGNLGAIIRSAEATGAIAVVIPERRATPLTQTVAKTSAGAIAHIPVVKVTNLVNALNKLKEEGFWVIGLAGESNTKLFDFDLRRPLVLVIGSEGKGIRPLVRQTCDALLSIPLIGRTESLNASVAAGIALYETMRQNSGKN